MFFAWFLQKSEASMVGVCFIWDLISKGPFWVLNHFLGIFGGEDFWKPILNFLSIINFWCTLVFFQNQKNETMKILLNLLKFLALMYQNGRVLWSFQATFRMPMTSRNIHTVIFVFNSSQGTPCKLGLTWKWVCTPTTTHSN